jgi:hypothetical protein
VYAPIYSSTDALIPQIVSTTTLPATVPVPATSAPHLAGFSRDVGYRRSKGLGKSNTEGKLRQVARGKGLDDGLGVMRAKRGCENRKETADLSTALRSGRDDKFVAGRCPIIHLMHAHPWPNKFVISTGVAMGLRPTQGDEKRLGPATTLYGTVALSFVIPSEAEGSAVPRTLPGNVFRSGQRSGEICGFLPVLMHSLTP